MALRRLNDHLSNVMHQESLRSSISTPNTIGEGVSDSAPSSPDPQDDDGDYFPTGENESLSSYDNTINLDNYITSPRKQERNKESPIGNLPSELLISIFLRLGSLKDLYSCLQVSRHWADCAVELLWLRPALTDVEKLTTIARSIQTAQPCWNYRDLIRRLNLASLGPKISNGTLQPFHECTRIERLTLTGCTEVDDGALVPLLKGNRQLYAIDATGLRHLTDLSVLTIAENCPRLQGLNLNGCELITNESLVPLAESCKLLKRLKLNNCHAITDASVSAIATHCTTLLELDLHGCKYVTDASVSQLFQTGRFLRELRLAHCPAITDDSFLPPPPEYGRYDTLRIVDLTGCIQLTDVGLDRIITAAPRIRILVLAKCSELTDRGVMSICRLGKNLHDIHLGRCLSIGDAAIKELVKHCSRIRYIDLAGCMRITDDSVKELASLPKLRRVGLVKCTRITDDSIIALAQNGMELPRAGEPDRTATTRSCLERVHLSYCSNITSRGVRTLLALCPKLTHLSLTGIAAFHSDAAIQGFCRDPPPEFTDEQRALFCVFSGDGVVKLRNYYNRPPAISSEQFEREIRRVHMQAQVAQLANMRAQMQINDPWEAHQQIMAQHRQELPLLPRDRVQPRDAFFQPIPRDDTFIPPRAHPIDIRRQPQGPLTTEFDVLLEPRLRTHPPPQPPQQRRTPFDTSHWHSDEGFAPRTLRDSRSRASPRLFEEPNSNTFILPHGPRPRAPIQSSSQRSDFIQEQGPGSARHRDAEIDDDTISGMMRQAGLEEEEDDVFR